MFQFFYICTHGYFPAIFHNWYLPDVASGIIVLLPIISLVPPICVVCEDDESNKVEFVLIYTHDEFTETLH